ncbi:MAG: type III-B CRISPR module RAMP protein Cmr1 [Meiothermus sp.]|uniref:type III-B CRISPR module RAMP protein Cmr1 n=1 Tax=Meiothermus sp. TaxID=1955249 RepID=UPI0025E90C08|nr:type III-B CRISPR module RAMP protein Cmr1 [Meiothermus sp.]MCS7069583.1 type III-B CRISPR module RAMP protein Cmr1 [Meiothermus sp.]MDW8425978.1 type III-B CRISPR module RAMP protein Cmr1 [Meiothermus sp.]
MRRVVEFREAYQPRLRDAYLVETRMYKLLTPLIGAGSSPFTSDLQAPIRGGSIRGVLRFWWRATCGNRFGNLKGMRSAEMAIWGSTDVSSVINVYVEVKPTAEIELRPTHKAKDEPDSSVIPAYISWPLNPPKEKPNDIKEVLLNLQFALTLRYPRHFEGRNLAEEIGLTLWAFDFFGGVGARTRRGAGAVCRVDEKGSPYYSKRDMEWGWQYISQGGSWPDGVPHLDTELKARLVEGDWSTLAEGHRSFFSEKFSWQNRGRKHSEVELIKHKRTALGAPFKWRGVRVGDRLASPVIYRPICLKEGNFSVVVALRNLGKEAPRANPALVKKFFYALGESK